MKLELYTKKVEEANLIKDISKREARLKQLFKCYQETVNKDSKRYNEIMKCPVCGEDISREEYNRCGRRCQKCNKLSSFIARYFKCDININGRIAELKNEIDILSRIDKSITIWTNVKIMRGVK